MKKIMAAIACVAFSGLAFAQTEPAPAPEVEYVSVNEVVAELESKTFDLSAQYWAWRVVTQDDLTLEGLKAFSKHWVGGAAFNEKLMKAVEENVKKGNTAKLTPEEEERLVQTRLAVRDVVMPARRDEALLKKLSPRKCRKLAARYWAWFIADQNKFTLEEYRANSGIETADKEQKKLIKAIEKNIKKGKTEALSKEEQYQYDGCSVLSEDKELSAQ